MLFSMSLPSQSCPSAKIDVELSQTLRTRTLSQCAENFNAKHPIFILDRDFLIPKDGSLLPIFKQVVLGSPWIVARVLNSHTSPNGH